MLIKLNGNARIENLRNYPQDTVEKLRALLAAGAEAHPDPRRRNYYDVENCRQVYFIHVSPLKDKVLLLAAWPKTQEQAKVEEAAVHTA